MKESSLHNLKFKQIVVVGCGGTGSYLVPVLCRYLASVKWEKPILLVDGDKFEDKNADRQEFNPKQVGQFKSDAMKAIVDSRIDGLNIISIGDYVGEKNISNIVPEGTIVFSCVDNHVCRAMLSKRCQVLDNYCLISAGNNEYDGNVQICLKLDGKILRPPIEDRHPEIMTRQDGDRSEMSCQELADLPGGGQTIIANMTAACISLQMFYAVIEQTTAGLEEVYFNIALAKTRRIINGIPE